MLESWALHKIDWLTTWESGLEIISLVLCLSEEVFSIFLPYDFSNLHNLPLLPILPYYYLIYLEDNFTRLQVFFSDQTLFFTTTQSLWANYRPTWNNSIMCKPWNPINHFLDQKISAKVKHLSQADCVSVPREEPLG